MVAPLHHFSCSSSNMKKVLILNLLLILLSSLLFSAQSHDSTRPFTPRKLFDSDQPKSILKNQTKLLKSAVSSKNQTKLIKPLSSSKNQTKLIKPLVSSKNQTKFTSLFSTKNQTKLLKLTTSDSIAKNKTKLLKSLTRDSSSSTLLTIKLQTKKSNSTSKLSNTTKSSSIHSGKSADLSKLTSPKNKTTKPISSKLQKSSIQVEDTAKSNSPDKPKSSTDKKPISIKSQKKVQPSWIEDDDDDDDSSVSGLRDLSIKFQETLLPDLEKISTTSKVYLTKANKEITRGMKPIVGKKYAASMASAISFAFIVIPLILVFLLCNRIKSYFSLQKLLIFVQAYLAIYFSILCVSSLVTGLEPLRFFYSTSQSTYVCLQVLQTLAYVLYLLLLLMYLVLVFSTDSGSGSKLLGLAQTIVGYAVGLHYYMTVFHHVVLRQPPKTNWKVHGIYATCYLVICLLATADRTKKSYLEASGEENKKN